MTYYQPVNLLTSLFTIFVEDSDRILNIFAGFGPIEEACMEISAHSKIFVPFYIEMRKYSWRPRQKCLAPKELLFSRRLFGFQETEGELKELCPGLFLYYLVHTYQSLTVKRKSTLFS